MNNKYEFNCTVVVGATLDIENTGNCAIVAHNDLHQTFVLIIKSDLGFTQTVEFGPSINDDGDVPSKIVSHYTRFEYNEYKIDKLVDNFLNNKYNNITQAEVVDFETAKQYIRNLSDLI